MRFKNRESMVISTGSLSLTSCGAQVSVITSRASLSLLALSLAKGLLGDSAKLVCLSALCNLSRKKSREVTAHFRADF